MCSYRYYWSGDKTGGIIFVTVGSIIGLIFFFGNIIQSYYFKEFSINKNKQQLCLRSAYLSIPDSSCKDGYRYETKNINIFFSDIKSISIYPEPFYGSIAKGETIQGIFFRFHLISKDINELKIYFSNIYLYETGEEYQRN